MFDLDRAIAEHGVAIIAVHNEHPHDSPFAYTVGRAATGRPELIAYGVHQDAAHAMLNHLHDRDERERLRDGATVQWPDGDEVRLHSAWYEHVPRAVPIAMEHAYAAATEAGRDGFQLELLQVEVPARDGHLPSTGGEWCQCCPDLRRPGSRIWPQPFTTEPHDWDSLPNSAVTVHLPVVSPGGHDEGRVEAVPAEHVAPAAVRLLRPPVLADWTTAGAVLELADRPDECGTPFAAVELERSPCVHLAYVVDERAIDEIPRLTRVLDQLAAMDRVTATFTTHWLAVAVPATAEARVRSLLRGLTRDGLFSEGRRFSEGPADLCTDPLCTEHDL